MSGQSIQSATTIEKEAMALTGRTRADTETSIEVTVLWNREVWQVGTVPKGEKAPGTYTIGEAPDCDFPVPAEFLGGRATVPLVTRGSDHTRIEVPQGAKGCVTFADGTFETLGEANTHVRLPFGATAELALGPWTFHIRSCEAPARFSAGWRMDWAPNFYTGLSFGLHAVFLFLIFLIPPSNAHLVFDPVDQSSRFFKYMIAVPEQKAHEVPDILAKNDSPEPEGNQGMRHEDVEGEAGKRDAPKVNKRYALKKMKDSKEIYMAKPMSRDMVRTTGVLGFLTTQDMPTSPFGKESYNGSDPENALGHLLGTEAGNAFGYDSLGVSGTGRGGGGNGEGTLGVGKIKTPGNATYGTRGHGLGKLTGRKAPGPRISGHPVQVMGALAKEVIRREIRRHLNEVSFCYESGLEKRPDLAGRVAIRFIITPTGAVQTALVRTSTLGDPQVEQCIAKVIGRISFPQPKGGGVVIVTYPFDLTSSGD